MGDTRLVARGRWRGDVFRREGPEQLALDLEQPSPEPEPEPEAEPDEPYDPATSPWPEGF